MIRRRAARPRMPRSPKPGGDRKGVGRTRRARPRFDEEFVDKRVPEWGDIIARVLERG